MWNYFFSEEFLSQSFWGSTYEQYLEAGFIFIIALIILGILQKIILSRLEKMAEHTKNDIDDIAVQVIASIKPQFYIIFSAYLALRSLTVNDVVNKYLMVILIIVALFQLTYSLKLVIEYIANKFSSDDSDESDEGEHAKSAITLLGSLVTIFIWIIGILLILSNVGINIASLLAGVGIGGIAIAFALKEILADLFASFSIYFDKPFKAGDSITIGDDSGVVEKIGIKTTRVRSSSGEEIIISNQDLTSERLHNFKQMKRRRVKLNLKITQETQIDKLRLINGLVENIINNTENVTFSRSHFKAIDDWSHIFQIVYYINSRDYVEFMDAQQEINFNVFEALEENNIKLAYPTQRVLEK